MFSVIVVVVLTLNRQLKLNQCVTCAGKLVGNHSSQCSHCMVPEVFDQVQGPNFSAKHPGRWKAKRKLTVGFLNSDLPDN